MDCRTGDRPVIEEWRDVCAAYADVDHASHAFGDVVPDAVQNRRVDHEQIACATLQLNPRRESVDTERGVGNRLVRNALRAGYDPRRTVVRGEVIEVHEEPEIANRRR